MSELWSTLNYFLPLWKKLGNLYMYVWSSLTTYVCESTLTHFHYEIHAYPKIGNVTLMMVSLYLSLYTCTNHMAGVLPFSSAVVSCIYHRIYHLGTSGKTLQLLAVAIFSLSEIRFECRYEIPNTVEYIQLLPAAALLNEAGSLSCPEISEQSLLK